MFWHRESIEFFTYCQVSLFIFFFSWLTLGKPNQKNPKKQKLVLALILQGCICVCVSAGTPAGSSPSQPLNVPAKPRPPSLVSHLCPIIPALLIPTPPLPCYLPPTPPLDSPASPLGEQSQRKCYNRGINQMYIQHARVNAELSHCAAS